MAFRVIFTMFCGFLLKMGVSTVFPVELLKEEIHGVACYLGVIGALYGIVLAFVIFVVWDQFNKVQTGIFLEGAALEDMCHTATFISDAEAAYKIKVAVREYIAISVADEATFLARGEMCPAATKAFLKVSDAVREVEIKKPKDQIVFGELFTALSRVNNARDARLGISSARIPGALWHLILLFSVSIIGGFLFLGIRLTLLANMMVGIIAGCIVFLLSVIQDIDNPFGGQWSVSYNPFVEVSSRLKITR
ncbi:MAG: DUF4239 domain-containing protein [Candidatus Riflebacteria bacterium]|nr:DUF4239 domain-containing protein [Candidatus Riflebacteria bacterium]